MTWKVPNNETARIKKNVVTNIQVSVALKHLDGRLLGGVVNIPVVNASCGDEAQSGLANPRPELDVIIHGAGLELLLLLEVKNLKCPRLSLEGNDLAVPVHDGTVGLDGPAGDVVAILELDDDDLWLCGFVLLLANTNVGIGFECL